jgi:hypothetical protein
MEKGVATKKNEKQTRKRSYTGGRYKYKKVNKGNNNNEGGV